MPPTVQKLVEHPIIIGRDSRDLSFLDAKGARRTCVIRPGQAFVWIAITPVLHQLETLHDAPDAVLETTVAIPALIDTGCSESVVVHIKQFDQWMYKCQLSRDPLKVAGEFPNSGTVNLNGLPCETVRANLWVFDTNYDNAFEQPDVAGNDSYKLGITGCAVSRIDMSKDYRVKTDRRMQKRFAEVWNAVTFRSKKQLETTHEFSKENPFPRLPLLGTRLFAANKMAFVMNLMDAQRPRFVIRKFG